MPHPADDKKRHHVAAVHHPCRRAPATVQPMEHYWMLQANNSPNARLLILDEDRIILQSLAQFLRREGYDVLTTDDPADALAIMEGKPIDLLLADINIPGVRPI